MKQKLQWVIALPIALTLGLQGPAHSQMATQGHGQVAGGNGRFGTTYTLKNSWNFVIYKARYTMEPYEGDSLMEPRREEKLFVFDIAFKNAYSDKLSLNVWGLFTLVDSTGQLYQAKTLLEDSQLNKGSQGSFMPGQGMGQPELKNGLHCAGVIPGNARIVKIIVNNGRKFAKPDESVYRYYIAGCTKAEAGADGDPKNVVAPLPANVADPSDPSGATALPLGKGVVGEYVPSEYFHMKVNSATFSTDPMEKSAPPNGKHYVVVSCTAQEMCDTRESTFMLCGGNTTTWLLTDTDGDTYKPDYELKAHADADIDHSFAKGDEYSFRVVFTIPTAVTIKNFVMGAQGGRMWAFDGSVVK